MDRHEELLARIAKEHLGIDNLAARHDDGSDFHDCAVWNLRAALDAAYAAGRDASAPPAARSVAGDGTGPAVPNPAANGSRILANQLFQYLLGYGRGDPDRLSRVAARQDWPEQAGLELEERARVVLRNLDDATLAAVASGQVDMAGTAQNALRQLADG